MNEISYALFSTPNNKKLISKLQEKEKNIFQFSPLKTEKKELSEEETNNLQNALNFDWLIFTDIFSVDYFIEFLLENNVDILDLDSVRICTFGESVSDKLRFSEIHSDLIATSPDTEKLAESIKLYSSEKDFSNMRFLILQEETNQTELAEILRREKGEVQNVSIYRITENSLTENTKLKALVLGGAVDEFIFSEPSEFIYFQKIFGNSLENNVLKELKFSVVNEVMFQMIFENGLKPNFLQLK